METFELQRYSRGPPPIARTRPPLSLLLLQNHSLNPPFSPTSPSRDLQAILDDVSSRDRGLSRPPDDPDVLMADSYLNYVNKMLMSGEDDDAAPPPDGAQASYDTILRSFYDVLREPLPLQVCFQESTSSGESSKSSLSLHSDENHSASSTSPSSNDGQYARTFEPGGQFSSLVKGGNSLARVRSARFEANVRPWLSKISSSIDTPFEGLKIEEDYASLYIGALSLSDTTNARKANSRNGVKKSSSRALWQSSQPVQNAVSAEVDFVSWKELLLNCARAMSLGNVKKANEILLELYGVHGVSPQGNCMQRLAHYFCDALVTRIAGIGGQPYRSSHEVVPPVASVLKSVRVYYESVPIMKVMYYFANQKILKVAERCARLHILDFGIMQGIQWPCLIKALADRDGGPPLLVITGIEMPWPGEDLLEKLKETGQRLAAYASRWNVPFQFHALLSDKWENINSDILQLHTGEVLVINIDSHLNQVPDELADSSSFAIPPRQRLLMNMHSLNPHLLLTRDFNLPGNSPFFVSRFQEMLHYFHSHVDMLETLCSGESDRYLLLGGLYRWSIHNMLVFDGAERVKRFETFKQWHLRFKRAGFELVLFPSAVMSRAVLYVKHHCHRDFMILQDANGWVLVGWRGRILQALSAWKPIQRHHKLRKTLQK